MNFSSHKHPLLFAIVACCLIGSSVSALANTQQTSVQQELKAIETSSGGKLGISAVNTANNERIQYRAEERFPMQSTMKLIGAAAILKKSMTDTNLLQQKIMYKKEDLVFWSPITEKHLTDGMTISELCAATIMYSDSTAINLLIKKLGGPQAINAFTRSIGNHTFRLDGWESDLNSNPNDLYDTVTPAAMEKSLQKLALGNILGQSQREQLITWMKGNTTGDARIRAGAPKGWIVGDKTGSGSYGITNDIAVIWPPKCSPIVVTIYFTQPKKDAPKRDDVIAAATRIIIKAFANTDSCLKKQL